MTPGQLDILAAVHTEAHTPKSSSSSAAPQPRSTETGTPRDILAFAGMKRL
jgi:hypothetical protein